MLAFSGYLTVKRNVSRKEYELVIPNFEVKAIFQDTIIEWFEGDIKVYKSLLVNTTNCLINNEIAKFEAGFKQIIGNTFSYYDTAKNHEYVYQAYILGLLAIIGDDYIIKSNRESGHGRYDIMLVPHDKSKNGVVIEIKQTEKQKQKESDTEFATRINQAIGNARSQIDQNKYCNELLENKMEPENIVKVAIVFAGKEPYLLPVEL
ncbi:MAG: PD-(D/E)XK nuclease domain-containing protein [Bacteroidales bacterium]|nr:PD-(D/E)XK nuclease domain-containing protein [Bacteroidales bacterium]MCF8454586.1 PD-(D/E)XK nuclease domain-containing protein [Bacteroidales bacterium]